MGNWFCRAKTMRMLILGLDAAGKTTLLYQMKLGEVITAIPTIGFNVESLHINGIDVLCWDVGSRDKIRPLWRHYFKGTHGFVYMIDSTDRERLQEAFNELVSNVLHAEECMNTVVMVVANKQDVEGAMTVQEIQDECVKRCHCRENSPNTFLVVPCNAKDGKQVNDIFQYFAHYLSLNEAGQAKRGLIPFEEFQAPMSKDNRVSNVQSLKNLLKNPLGYFKTFF